MISGNFFQLPFTAKYFDVIFANCFFDFCKAEDFEIIMKEMKRVLKDNGKFFAVYMEFPSTKINRLWNVVFRHAKVLSQGCHPVDIRSTLINQDLAIKKDISLNRFGFPLKYIEAKKI